MSDRKYQRLNATSNSATRRRSAVTTFLGVDYASQRFKVSQNRAIDLYASREIVAGIADGDDGIGGVLDCYGQIAAEINARIVAAEMIRIVSEAVVLSKW